MSNLSSLPPLRLPEVPSGPGPDAVARPGAAAPAAQQAAPTPTLPNPSLRLDAALGLVVLEFRNADGTARTIPSERELQAYRSAAPARQGGAPGDTGDPAAS